METQQNNQVLAAINAVITIFTQQIVEQATKPLVERIDQLEREVVTLNTALNTVIFTYTPQMAEKSTNPLVERIVRLEQQNHELYDIIGISLKGHVNNAVNISMAAVKQDVVKEVLDTVKIEVIKPNLLDAVDEKIEAAIKNITADNITGFSEAVDEAVQNQAPLNADDIVGLRAFVKSEIDDRLDDDELESELTNKIRDAFQAAVDSL
jgi:hypothetical protein